MFKVEVESDRAAPESHAEPIGLVTWVVFLYVPIDPSRDKKIDNTDAEKEESGNQECLLHA